jgi:RNA polymerase sigma-70 factor (ECF subfamily)
MKPIYCRPNHLKERALANDPDLVADLFACFRGELTSYLRKRCRNEQDTEDALQEAFANVATKIDSYRGDAPISSWLFTLATNACFRNRRTMKDNSAIHQPHDETLIHNPEEELAQIEQTIEAKLMPLENALEKLNKLDRAVLLLRDGQEMTAKEVSEQLDISESAVKSRLHRARKSMQEILAEYYQPST